MSVVMVCGYDEYSRVTQEIPPGHDGVTRVGPNHGFGQDLPMIDGQCKGHQHGRIDDFTRQRATVPFVVVFEDSTQGTRGGGKAVRNAALFPVLGHDSPFKERLVAFCTARLYVFLSRRWTKGTYLNLAVVVRYQHGNGFAVVHQESSGGTGRTAIL
eukprot:scaffold3233_cov178-Amphora_coffeaeformis.AAC.8